MARRKEDIASLQESLKILNGEDVGAAVWWEQGTDLGCFRKIGILNVQIRTFQKVSAP